MIPWDSEWKWDCMELGEIVMIGIPLRRDYISGVRAEKQGCEGLAKKKKTKEEKKQERSKKKGEE